MAYTGMKREPTHITAAQFVLMHEYCLTVGDIARTVQRSGYTPRDIRPVCEHPNHGHCGHREPSEEQLADINARLAGKEEEEVKKKAGFSYYCMKCESWHIDHPDDSNYETHFEHKRGRGRPQK